MKLIDKDALVTEITHKIKVLEAFIKNFDGISDKVEKAKNKIEALNDELLFIENLEVKDLYEQCIQYDSIKAGIQAHAETYSFNIESLLFNQLTKEQQALWRKEIEQACISGGEAGVELARDIRYKENLEVKEVDLNDEYTEEVYSHLDSIKDTANRMTSGNFMHNIEAIKFSVDTIAKVLELMGLKAQNIWHDANEKLPAGVIVVSNCGSLKIGWSTDEGDGIEDEHGCLITKTYQKWAREEDLA